MSQPRPDPPGLSPASPLPLPHEEDWTPYGQSPAFGVRSFLHTCWWVATAGAQRLTHLALQRRTSASRRFVRWVIAWLAVSAGLLQLGHVGWHTATRSYSGSGAQIPRPEGRGWYHIAGGDPLEGTRSRNASDSVWWNPTLALLAAVQAFLITTIAAFALLAWQRHRVERALAPPYQGHGRLEAAMHYGTAWLLSAAAAATVASASPLAELSAVAGWTLIIPRATIYGIAALLAILGFCGYWFGLIRAGATVPAQARSRVVAFFGVWNPLIIVLTVCVAGAGLHFWMRFLSTRMGLAW